MNLEQEFENYKFIHKSSIVLGCLLKYYNELQNTGITIPAFMNNSAEENAKEHYYKLLADNNRFNEIYESCWQKYGALLP